MPPVPLWPTWTKGSSTRGWSSGAMPQPVSRTEKRRAPEAPSAAGVQSAEIATEPSSVNLTALETRFTRIWRTRSSSSINRGMGPAATLSSMPFCSTWKRKGPATRESSAGKSHGAEENFIFSASSLERSSTSFTSESSVWELKRMFSMFSARSFGSATPSRSISEKPMMELSGVRMSWLTIEKNMLRAFSAASVASRSRRRSSISPRFLRVIRANIA